MIRYGKGWWGTGVLTRMYGSAFPRALPFSLLATLMAVLLSIFFQELLDDQFLNPYPYQTFAFIVGFMIVFRCEPVYLFKRFESSANKLAAIWNQAPARYKVPFKSLTNCNCCRSNWLSACAALFSSVSSQKQLGYRHCYFLFPRPNRHRQLCTPHNSQVHLLQLEISSGSFDSMQEQYSVPFLAMKQGCCFCMPTKSEHPNISEVIVCN